MSMHIGSRICATLLALGACGTAFADQGGQQPIPGSQGQQGQMGQPPSQQGQMGQPPSQQGQMGQQPGQQMGQQPGQQMGQTRLQQVQGVKVDKLGRNEVREVQQALQDRGFYSGEINGRVTPEFHAALGAFQYQLGMQPTPEINEQIAQALGVQISEIQPVRGQERQEKQIEKEQRHMEHQQQQLEREQQQLEGQEQRLDEEQGGAY